TDCLEQLQDAIVALSDEMLVGPFSEDARTLMRLRSRLDAQIARRVVAFDASREWSADGARSAAGWIARELRMTHPAARREVRMGRQTRHMPVVTDSWEDGRMTSAHVSVLAHARLAADADDSFKELEEAFVAVAESGTPDDVRNITAQWRDAVDAERDDR